MSRLTRVLTMTLLVVAAGIWTLQTLERERLKRRVDQAGLVTRALARVRAEHELLRRRQPFVGEIDTLRRDRTELAGLRRELSQRQQAGDSANAASAALGREVLPMGIWLPTDGMQDLGRSTPHAALQTLFWAARGRQLPALKELITFEPGAREQAERVLAGLPPGAGLPPAAAEMLMAQSVVERPPMGEVQLIAEYFRGFDDATEFLAWRTPGGEIRAMYLRLRWEPGGWRVVVPVHAVATAVHIVTGAALTTPRVPTHDLPRLPEP